MNYQDLVNDIKVGDTVLVDNGLLRLEVLEKNEARIRCRVLIPGELKSKRHDYEFVYLDDWWIKYNFDRPEVDELYRYTQKDSRTLAGRGAALRREDLGELAKG